MPDLTLLQPFNLNTTGNFTFANTSVTGNLSSGNANLGNLVTANFFVGDGSLLTGVTAATVTTNAQPNITSLGTLTSLTVTGNSTINNVSLTGNIIPSVTNTYALGNATHYFKDAFIGPGSLYVNGKKVLEEVSGTINFTTDINQNLKVTTSGSGDILFDPTGTGVISIKGPLQIETGINITSSDGNSIHLANPLSVDSITTHLANTDLSLSANGTGTIRLNDDVTVSGNLTVSGTTTYINTETVQLYDNIIDLNSNFTTGSPTENAGIRVLRGDEAAVLVRWNETTDKWQYTTDGSAYVDIVGTTSLGVTSLGNSATANYFTGNGSLLTSITGSNVSGNVTSAVQAHYANIANSVAVANVTGIGNIATINKDGNVSNILYGNGVFAAAPAGGGSYGNSNVATFLASYGSNTIITTGNVSVGNIIGNGQALTSITGSNVSGNVTSAIQSHYANIANSVAGANVSGNVSSAVQSHYANIANSVAGANVSGEVTYAATANAVAGANVSGNVSSAVQSHYANIANSVAGANVSGNVTSAVQSHYANIANSVSWSNISSTPTTLSGYGITDAYANSNVASYLPTYTGELAGANLILTGNLVISGTTTSVNSTVTRIVDPIFELGGGANGAPLTTDDNKDRGTLLHYYTGSSAVDAFMGWDDSNVEFGFGSNVTVTNEVATFNTYGNLRAGYFLGNGSQLTGVSASSSLNIVNGTSNVNIATVNGNITMGIGGTADVVTITTTGVNVAGYVNTGTGNISAGNVSGGNAVSATYIIGNGSLLTSITGANVSGNVTSAVQAHYANIANSVAGANVSGNVSSAVQSHYANIANSVAGSNVSGNVSSAVQSHYANIANSVAGSNVSGEVTYAATANSVASANVSGQVGNALVASTVYTAAQPNITSIGSLTGLIVSNVTGVVDFTTTANVTLGSVSNLHVSGGTNGYVLSTDGSGGLSWVAQSGGGGSYSNTNTAAYLPTYTGNVSANYFIGNGSTLTFITGSNVSGNVTSAVQSHYANIANSVAGANVSGQVTYAGTANSVAGANVSGNVTSAVQSHYANIANSVAGSNVSGAVSSATTAGTVTTAAQPNITSTGTLTSLTSGTHTISANANITMSGSLSQVSGANLVSANYGAFGGQIPGQNFNLVARSTDNVIGPFAIQATVANNYSGASFFDNSNALQGAVGYANPSTTYYPGQLYMWGSNGIAFSGNGYATTGGTKNMYINSSGIVTIPTGVSASNTTTGAFVVTGGVGISGNLHAGNLSGTNITGTLTTAAQPNITSVGTLTGLTSTGIINLTGTSNVSLGAVGNVKITGGTNGYVLSTDGSGGLSWVAQSGGGGSYANSDVATFLGSYGSNTIVTTGNVSVGNIIGNGQALTSITGANVSGAVSSATTAGTVTTAAQGNITSVGTLTGLTVTGLTNLGAIGNITITGGTNGYVLQTNGSGVLSWVAQSGGGGGGSSATINDDTTTNATYYPVYATASSGSLSTAGVSSTKLQFNPSLGQLTVTDLNSLSDATLKTNWQTIDDPFSILDQLFGMGFDWLDNGRKSYGLSAQNVEKILPELVGTTAQGKKTVNYIPIIAFLLEALKKNNKELQEIKNSIQPKS